MGIHTNFIVSEMRDFIPMSTCSICSTILEDVITIKCSHHFCKSCLINWIQNQEISESESVACPKCQAGFDPNNDTNKCQAICDVLTVLKFKCSNQLCEETIGYDGYHGHHQLCLYSPILCEFCDFEMMRKDLDTHLLGCVSYITDQNAKLDAENKSLKTTNDRLEAKMNLLETKITSQDAAYDLLFTDFLKTEITDYLKVENDSLKIENDSLNAKIKELVVENDTLKSKLDSLKTKFKVDCKLLKTENDLMKTENTYLDLKLKEIKTEVEKEMGL